MSYRAQIASTLVNTAISVGRSLGCEEVVTVDNHSVTVGMRVPGESSKHVWDRELYNRGQLYYRGYANPIKPRVAYNKEIGEKDEVYMVESDAADGEVSGRVHTRMMSSPRFHQHMNNHMISELVTPDEKWTKLLYAIAGVGIAVVFFGALTLLVGAGVI